MKNSEIYSHVDHTLLKAEASWNEIEVLCNESVRYNTASVCVPPSYVKRISEAFPQINICTVIGFPLGNTSAETKIKEAETAVADGAGEIDMVINIGDVKNKDFDKITEEIKSIRNAAKGKILKVIIETCYLDEEEKIALCRCVTQAGADYIKTSTGFGTAGASMKDILLFEKYIGKGVKIKAAGGIRNRQDMIDFINAGCGRLGTSSAVKILSGEEGAEY